MALTNPAGYGINTAYRYGEGDARVRSCVRTHLTGQPTSQ